MIKNNVKKITLLFMIAIIVFSFTSNVNAEAEKSDKSAKKKGADFSMSALISDLDEGAGEKDKTANAINDIVTTVITIARVIGVAVAIVMLLVVAMKYMTAAPGEKADIKKSAVVYVVGAIVLFAVTGILGIINAFSSNISLKTK